MHLFVFVSLTHALLFLLAICLQGCGGRVKDGQVDFKEVRHGID